MKCVYNHLDWFENVVKSEIKEMLDEFVEFYRKKSDQVVVGCCIVFNKTPIGCTFTLYYEYDFYRSNRLTSDGVKQLVYKKNQERVMGSTIFAKTMMIQYGEYNISDWISELLKTHDRPDYRNHLVFTITPVAGTDYMDYEVKLQPSDNFDSCPCLDNLNNPRRELSLEVNFDKAYDFRDVDRYLNSQLRDLKLQRLI